MIKPETLNLASLEIYTLKPLWLVTPGCHTAESVELHGQLPKRNTHTVNTVYPVHIYIYICMYTYIYIYQPLYIHVYIYIYAYIVCVCVCICITLYTTIRYTEYCTYCTRYYAVHHLSHKTASCFAPHQDGPGPQAERQQVPYLCSTNT